MDFCFTTKLNLSKEKIVTLEKELYDLGFSVTKPQYTYFKAQRKKLVITYYLSGSFVIQGKDQDEIISTYIEPKYLPKLDISYPVHTIDTSPRIGSDEAGKGDIFGPLCVASVFIDESHIDRLFKAKVKDSKKLSDNLIIKAADTIKSICPYEIVILYPEKYNHLYEKMNNLNHLLAWCHIKAIEKLCEKTKPEIIILDRFGSESYVENLRKRSKIPCNIQQIVRAESDLAVAAASILARAAFLRGLKKLEDDYGVTLSKGAGLLAQKSLDSILSQDKAPLLPFLGKLHFKTFRSL